MNETVKPTSPLEAYSALPLLISRKGDTGCQVSRNYLIRDPFFSICGGLS